MTLSPIAAQDRSEPPEGYLIYEDFDGLFRWDDGESAICDPFHTYEAALRDAWAHSEREQG